MASLNIWFYMSTVLELPLVLQLMYIYDIAIPPVQSLLQDKFIVAMVDVFPAMMLCTKVGSTQGVSMTGFGGHSTQSIAAARVITTCGSTLHRHKSAAYRA